MSEKVEEKKIEEKKVEEKVPEKKEKKVDEVYFFKRIRIIQKYDYKFITLREFDSMECDGAAVLEGFNKGLTSVMATNYVVDQLKLPLVGDIVSNKFQNYCRVENGFPYHGCRIYGNKRLVVFTSEYDFKDPLIQNELVGAMYDFARRHRNRIIISVDGVPGDPSKTAKEKVTIKTLEEKKKVKPPTKEELMKKVLDARNYEQKIWFLTNDRDISSKMKELGHEPVKTMAVTGICGGILAESPYCDVPVCAIFGNLDPFLKIGTKTSISLIQCIDKVLGEGVKIDCTEITATNQTIEKKIQNIVKDIKTPIDAKKPSPWKNMYM